MLTFFALCNFFLTKKCYFFKKVILFNSTLGGVKCHNATSCIRTDAVLTLNMPDIDDPTKASWEETTQLLEPKSSHNVLVVPKSYVPKCKRN